MKYKNFPETKTLEGSVYINILKARDRYIEVLEKNQKKPGSICLSSLILGLMIGTLLTIISGL